MRVVPERSRYAGAYAIRGIDSRFDELNDVAVIPIDIPIGFGPRSADAAAHSV